MNVPLDIADRIASILKKARTVLIISHRNPDPDTIGSNAALRLTLEKKGIKVTSFCIDELPPTAKFLPIFETFVIEAMPEEFDLYVSVDAGSISQAAYPVLYPEVLKGPKPFINIDHHPSNNRFGTENLIVENAASTTLVILELLKIWGEKITAEIATCLLYGLYYDTGSFMHSNTCDEVYQAASELLDYGADHKIIIKNLFKSHSLEQMKLWGKVFSGVEVTDKNVVVAAITEKDFDECRADKNDLSGAIDYLSSIPNSQFATLLSEDTDGQIRGSLRTRRNDVNVSEIAKNLGGGGHTKASGFSIKGKLQREERWSIDNQ